MLRLAGSRSRARGSRSRGLPLSDLFDRIVNLVLTKEVGFGHTPRVQPAVVRPYDPPARLALMALERRAAVCDRQHHRLVAVVVRAGAHDQLASLSATLPPASG